MVIIAGEALWHRSNLVCIGDSTTHEPVGNAYPFQLQGITGRDVVVIGNGIRGTNVPFWITNSRCPYSRSTR